MTDCR